MPPFWLCPPFSTSVCTLLATFFLMCVEAPLVAAVTEAASSQALSEAEAVTVPTEERVRKLREALNDYPVNPVRQLVNQMEWDYSASIIVGVFFISASDKY
jgi:hypothetical protein